MANNLDTQLPAIKGTNLPIAEPTIAEGVSVLIAKGKITAAQVHNNCPVELADWCKRVAAHLDLEHKYQKKLADNADTVAKLLALIADACDEEAFEACRKKFYPALGRSRTYELKAIATGTKTIEQIRAETRERVARHRAKKSVTSHVTDNGTGTGEIDTGTGGNGTLADDEKEKSAEGRKACYTAQESNTTAEVVPAIPDDDSIPEILRRNPGTTNEADAQILVEREKACNAALEIWHGMTPEQRQFLGQKVLTEFFETAEGGDLHDHIPAARRADVARRFLGRLGVEGMLAAVSPDFKAQLCAKQPANPAAWLVKKDAETIAAVITEKIGAIKAAAIRKYLPDRSAPKQFPKLQMAPTTDASGNTIHVLKSRGNRSRH